HQRESCGPTLTIKSTDDFLQRVSQLSRIAKEQKLSYLVADLSGLEHAWSVSHIYSPNTHHKSDSYLCVSAEEVWIKADVEDSWSHNQYETQRISLADIGPIDLVLPKDQRLPASIKQSWIKPYANRIKAIREAQAIYEALLDASYDLERSTPSEQLALFDRLIFSGDEEGPFIKARQAWSKLESYFQHWEVELDAESVSICQDVLGIDIGDIVIVDSNKGSVRLAVDGMSLHSSDEHILFAISGKRFRKDGLPGKRDEYFYIEVSNDQE
ncbi:MAG: hypothetical protein LC540_11060, partial [Candidatus Thiodiazotropha sp.]|nr:hypothetical protein [Candidatus Thiodiazotropha sp.]